MKLPDYWPGWSDIGAALRNPRCIILASSFVFIVTILIQTIGVVDSPLKIDAARAEATRYNVGTLITYTITGTAHRDVLVDSARSVRCHDGSEEDVTGMTRNLIKAGKHNIKKSIYIDHEIKPGCVLHFTLFWQPDFSIVYQSAVDMHIEIDEGEK